MILYRPVGLQEAALIYDSGMTGFPAGLPHQPVFYPVLDLEYARQVAADWNVNSGQLAGYVTCFKVEDEYIGQFEVHTVGETRHRELWIPADQMEEFNRHITGHIRVLEAYFGEGFQGFVPERFGMQGKNAVEQFSLLANAYLYRRMDFYLEIKRNHKAVFLNYPFWQRHRFPNPGQQEKVLQAIREAWLTSFPGTPLPNPVHTDSTPRELTGRGRPDSASEDPEAAASPAPAADSAADAPEAEAAPARETGLPSARDPVSEPVRPGRPSRPPAPEPPAPAGTRLPGGAGSHFEKGIELGLKGRAQEAIHELTRAVEDDPGHVAARTSLGVAFRQAGEDDRALDCYEAALQIDPIHAEAHYFRANILYSQGNVREAIAGYTLAVGLQPELIEAHQKPLPRDRLTEFTGAPAAVYRIARPAQRILALSRLLEADSGQAVLFRDRGADYFRLRNYARAIADYSACLALQPDDGAALHARGLAYEQLGQVDRAQEDYRAAAAVDPGLWNLHINRGVAFGSAGNYRQAIVSLTDAIRLAPGKADGYFNRGMAYFQEGDLESAIADLSAVIRLSPGDEEAYYWRGISQERAGRQPQAAADFRQFLAMSQNPEARAEIEGRLSQWTEGPARGAARPETEGIPSGGPDREPDLYRLLVALGGRALRSTWLVSGVDCDGEKAEELYACADQEQPIEGRDLLSIASGIRQTVRGDFQGFDPGAPSPWIFIRARDGSGFYIETSDSGARERLRVQFPGAEEVDEASPPYESLFIRS